MSGLAPTRPRLSALVDLAVWLGCIALAQGVLFLFGRQLSGNSGFVQLAIPAEALVLLAVATVLLRRRGETWRSIGLAPPPLSPPSFVRLVIGGYVAMVVGNALLAVAVYPKLGLETPKPTILKGLRGDPWAYVYWLLIAWTSAAVGEELLFRGFLFSRLERLLGGGRPAVIAAIVGQAALFGLGHLYQGVSGVLITTCVGVVMGGMFLAGRRNLVACMVLHGLIDTVSITVLFLGWLPASVTG